MRHKILKTCATLPLLAAAALYSSAAFSAATSDAFVVGQQEWSDDSAEVLVNNDANATIDPGDYLVGILGITSFPTSGVDASTVNEMTAIFAAEVVSVSAIDPIACSGGGTITSCSTFVFKAVPDFNAAVAAADGLTGASSPTFTQLDGSPLTSDTIAIFLEDSANNFNRDGGSQADGFNTTTDGTSRLIVEQIAANGDFWSAIGPADILEFLTVDSGSGVGSFNINATITGQGYDGWVFDPRITASGNLKPTETSSFLITDDATFEVNASKIPEPATLGLMSLGLLGFAASRRRKDRSGVVKG